MKRTVISLLLIAAASIGWAQEPITEKNDTLSYLLGVNFGSFIKGNGLPFDHIDHNELSIGISDLFVAEGSPYEENFGLQFKHDPNTMEEVFKRAIASAEDDTEENNNTLSYLLGVNFGSFIKGNNFPAYKIDYGSVLNGISDYLYAQGIPSDPEFGSQFKYDPHKMNELFNRVVAEAKDIQAATNYELETSFMNANSLKYGVMTTDSGLQYKILRRGKNPMISPTDTVIVNYKGIFLDGTVFDERKSIEFALNTVIDGWQEGITKVGEGGKIILYIPSHLAYGAKGNTTIEPYATLIFHIEVLAHWNEVARE